MSDRSKKHRSSRSETASARSVTHTKTDVPSTTNQTFLDEIDFSLPYEDRLQSSTQRVITHDGEITYQAQNRVEVSGRFDVANYRIRTIQGSELRVQVCPPKVKYGHNAAGRGALRPVVIEVIEFLAEKLKVHFGLSRLERPRPESVRIHSVSLVRHLRFDTTAQASTAVTEISGRCQARGYQLRFMKAGETISATRNPRVATVTFYVKETETRVHPTARRSPDFDAVVGAIQGWLRVEIRVTSATLKKRGLDSAGGWKAATANSLFDNLFDEFAFLDLLPVTPTPTVIDATLSASLRRAVALARLGEDLGSHYSQKHVRSLVEKAAEVGIDLRSICKPVEQGSPPISLSDRWVTDVPDNVKAIRGFKDQFAPDT